MAREITISGSASGLDYTRAVFSFYRESEDAAFIRWYTSSREMVRKMDAVPKDEARAIFATVRTELGGKDRVTVTEKKLPAALEDRVPNLRKIEAHLVEKEVYRYRSDEWRQELEPKGMLAIDVFSGYLNVAIGAMQEMVDAGDIQSSEKYIVSDYISRAID